MWFTYFLGTNEIQKEVQLRTHEYRIANGTEFRLDHLHFPSFDVPPGAVRVIEKVGFRTCTDTVYRRQETSRFSG